jgi:hypothetical protein
MYAFVLTLLFSLNELVHDGENGLVFDSSEDLAEQFMVKIIYLYLASYCILIDFIFISKGIVC